MRWGNSEMTDGRLGSSSRRLGLAIVGLAIAMVAGACSGAGGGGGGAGTTTITLAAVDNPSMADLKKLLPEFTNSHPTIKVNIVTLPEDQLRQQVTQDVAAKSGRYDLFTIGTYEVPLWAKKGWIENLSPFIAKDSSYDAADLIPGISGALSYKSGLYAVPFYGESSMLMYRKDLLQAKGQTMPDHPTWDQVAAVARAVNSSSVSGICLRGLPGWGEQLAPLTTVVNTFGGRWYDETWKAQLDAPESSAAIKFYIDTLKTVGEPGSTQAGFTECETLMVQGKVGMWYDATSAADLLFDPKQNPSASNMAMAYAPTKEKMDSGWLWAWAFAMEANSKNKPAAYEFLKWATSKDFVNLVAQKSGWGAVPSGVRKSTYDAAGYKDYAKGFAAITLDSIQKADPSKPTVKPVPYTGVQFVQIPEFQDLGTRVSQEFAAAIAGQQSADDAIKKANDYANQVAKQGGYQK